MKLKQLGKDFAKGAVIGGSMLLPGVSGGTCAIIIGIYDRLIKVLPFVLVELKPACAVQAIMITGQIQSVVHFYWIPKQIC